MDDLISRQAAIGAIEEYADRLQMVNWKENPNVPYKVHSLNWCINTIRDLPSAQQETEERTAESVQNVSDSDLISRKAAIELFADAHLLDYISQAYLEKIRAVPSAQPELIRCRDCKWWDSEYRECHSPNWDTGKDEYFVTPPGFFCGWANRKR